MRARFESLLTENAWKRLRWIFLAVSILFVVVQRWIFAVPNQDNSRLIDVAYLILEGKGIAFTVHDWNDLSKLVYVPSNLWPPGLPLILALLVVLTGSMQRAMVGVEILSAIVFFGSWFVIVEHMEETLTVKARLLVWSVWALGAEPLFAASMSLRLAVAFFSCSIALAAQALRSERRAPALAAASGAVMGLAFISHYMTWPYVLAVPMAGLGLAWLTGDRSARRVAWVHLAVAVTALAALSLWLHARTGHVTFLDQRLKYSANPRLAWNKLATIYPFFSSAVGLERVWLYLRMAGVAMDYWDHSPAAIFERALLIPTIVLAIAYGLEIRGQIRKPPVSRAEALGLLVRLSGVITIGLTVGMLAYLTLKIKSGNLTFLEVPRYYIPAYPFIVIGIAAYLFPETPRPSGTGQKILAGAVAILMIASIPAVLYVRGRYLPWAWENRKESQIDRAEVLSRIRTYSEGATVECRDYRLKPWMCQEMMNLRIPVIFSFDQPREISTTQPVFLVTCVPPDNPRDLNLGGSLFKEADIHTLFGTGSERVVGLILKPGTYDLKSQ